ncbi:MAG: hypothetical protein COC24_018100 [Alphaproteobacteria bacterium]|nr:hypothetical protein [Alphaproteobacteria bacterium]
MTRNTHFRISNVNDFYQVPCDADFDEVTIETRHLKHEGVIQLALRRALAAIKTGGVIRILDDSAERQRISPYLINFPTVRALCLICLGADCSLTPNVNQGELLFTRHTDKTSPGWSAGIIFSGNDSELPTLKRCLDGLLKQSELTGPSGEVIVCGPKRDLAFLDPYPMVRYLAFDVEFEGHFPIALKKNFLMAAMKFPRMLVLHARIVLDENALSNTPNEFDILSPNVFIETTRGREPNVCYVALDSRWPNQHPKIPVLTTRHISPMKYLKLLKHRKPYVNGGAFAVSRVVFEKCPLNPQLKWGDCEDVEWCLRAQTLGYGVDLALHFTAISLTNMVRDQSIIPLRLATPLRRYMQVVRSWKQRVHYHVRRLLLE